MATHIEGCPECREFLERRVQDWPGAPIAGEAELPSPDALPRIDGFTIERELGRGAMGVVYLAHRHMPSRLVALKLLPGGRRASQRERRQWLREAEAVSLVRHPNVVTLHEVAETDDWFLLVLEYIPGGTLADQLRKPLAPPDAARLIETIACAVHHIHLNGQLHLDLKPSNILLDGDVSAGWEAVIPKVSDFGIARSAEASATETGGIGPGGTPSYMAPEQIIRSRKDLSPMADIHGLGAILYHMLTGRPPYQGATVVETIDLVQRQEPVPPRRLNPRIPRDLETICLKCVEKDPSRRYASAELLAGDLARWLDGRPILGRPVSPIGKGWRWCVRRPLISALAAALILTLAIGFAAVVILWRRAEANFRTSNEMLNDLVDLGIGGEVNLPKVMTLERLIPFYEMNTKRLLALAAVQPADLSVADRLATVQRRLSESLMQVGRFEDARTVLIESLGRLDVLIRRFPADESLRAHEFAHLRWLADVSGKLGKIEDNLRYLTRAVQSSLEGNSLRPTARRIARLFQARQVLGLHLWERGDHEPARQLFAENGRLVEICGPESEDLRPFVLRLLAHIDKKLFIEDVRAAQPAATEGSPLSSPLSGLGSPADNSQAARDWASLAADAIRSSCPDVKLAARLEAEDTSLVMTHLSELASHYRRHGQPDEARRIVARMLALGNYLITTCPGEPWAHLALSDAYFQMSKDGWQTKDWGTIEDNLKLGLDAALRASTLDPSREPAQRKVSDLQRRLARLRGDFKRLD
jgi:tetratricopeptide (TPR) repeat protein